MKPLGINITGGLMNKKICFKCGEEKPIEQYKTDTICALVNMAGSRN